MERKKQIIFRLKILLMNIRKIFCLPFLGLGWTLFAQNTMPDSVEMQSIILEFRRAIMADFKPSPVAPAPEFSRFPVPGNLSATALKEALNYFSGGFYFGPGFNPGELLVESDHFYFPDAKQILVDYKWTKALSASGKNLLDMNNPDNQRLKTQLDLLNTYQVKLTDASAELPVSLEGDFAMQIPVRYDQITITREELLTPKKLKNHEVQLFRMERDIAAIWTSADDQRFSVYPLFAGGQPLAVLTTTIMKYDPSDTILSSFMPKMPGPGSIVLIKAKGYIEQITLLYFAELSSQKVKIKALPQSVFTPGETPKRERHVPFAPVDFSKLKPLDEQSVRLATVFALNEHNIFGQDAPQWEFEVRLPPILQAKFAQARFNNLKVYNKKKLLMVLDTTGYFDESDMTLATMPENEAFEKVAFDRITGTVTILMPQKIQTLTVKKGEKKSGIIGINGSEVTVAEDEWNDNLMDVYRRSGLMAFRAYGQGKYPLKRDSQESYEYANDVGVRKFYFYGSVSSVQLDQPSDWLEISVPFDISRSEPVKKPQKKPKKQKP